MSIFLYRPTLIQSFLMGVMSVTSTDADILQKNIVATTWGKSGQGAMLRAVIKNTFIAIQANEEVCPCALLQRCLQL